MPEGDDARPSPAMPWDEAAWPWWSAALVVTLDLAGAAAAHFGMGWTVYGTPRAPHLLPEHFLAIFGNWAIITRLFLALTLLLYFRGRGVPWRAFGLTPDTRGRWVPFAKVLALSIAAIVVLSAASVIVLRATGHANEIEPPLHLATSSERQRWIWIFVVAMPPFEELMYRAILYPMMRRHMGPVAAVLLNGMVFGLLHYFYGIPIEGVPAYAVGGAILAWVYERTGSLAFPWIVHAAANLAAVVISNYPGWFETLRG
ncbi:MAG TPA: type II CAAX endopeptidase family protein [Planctomycetota bacterium]|nr:type II CAAX endopeptidase family protein [Planctomycetota bacterium]